MILLLLSSSELTRLETLARDSDKKCFTDSPKASGCTHPLHGIHPSLNEGPGQEEGDKTLQTGCSIVHIWSLLKYRQPLTHTHTSRPVSAFLPPFSPYGRTVISLYQLLSSFPLSLQKDPALLPINIKSLLLHAFQPFLTIQGGPTQCNMYFLICYVHDTMLMF